jgi:hypothetical protein
VAIPTTAADASALPIDFTVDNLVFYLSIFGVTVCAVSLVERRSIGVDEELRDVRKKLDSEIEE